MKNKTKRTTRSIPKFKKEGKKEKRVVYWFRGGGGCSGVLEERQAAWAQSQSCPSKSAVAGMGVEGERWGAGFSVSWSCLHLHRGMLFCSLKSHHVGGGGENAPPQYFIPGPGIAIPAVPAALTE